MKRSIPLPARLAVLAGVISQLLQPDVSARSGGPDGFGYRFKDQAEAGVDFHWIDVPRDTTLVLSALAVGTINLEVPAMFYGTTVNQLRISELGYLTTDLTDSGADSTPDCGLPHLASSGGGNRIYALHSGQLADVAGTLSAYYNYFPVSPHPHHTGGVHVITWQGAKLAGSAEFSFQVLLFDNTDIMIQIHGLPSANPVATVGIQDLLASAAGSPLGRGIEYYCQTGPAMAANTAVLFEMPNLVVNTLGDVVNSGDGLTSLREAVSVLTRGGKIRFAPALDGGELTINSDIVVTEPISFDASSLPNGIAVTDSGPPDTFDLESHTQFLGFTFRNMRTGISGSADSAVFVGGCQFNLNSGAGLFAVGPAVVTNSAFAGNGGDSSSGHALAGWGGSADIPIIRVEGCQFSLNQNDTFGGAISLSRVDRCLVRNCTFTGNTTTGAGGAIGAVLTDSLEIEGGSFHLNTADCVRTLSVTPAADLGGGAVLFANGGSLSVARSSFTSNSAAESPLGVRGAGGVHCVGSNAEIVASTFHANSNGAIEGKSGSDLYIHLCTIANNTGEPAIQIAGAGAELELYSSTLSGNSSTHILGATVQPLSAQGMTFGNNIFADSGGIYVVGGSPITSLGQNIFDNNQSGFTGPNDRNNLDPMLGTYGDHGGPTRTINLLPGSPAIDQNTGSGGQQTGVDQRDYKRPSGLTADTGAFEFQSTVQVTTAEDELLFTFPQAGNSLREALTMVADGGTITFAPSLDGAAITSAASADFLPEIPPGVTIDATGLPNRVRFHNERTMGSPPGSTVTFKGIIWEREHAVLVGAGEFYDCDFVNVPRSAVLSMGDLHLERCRILGGEGLSIRDQVAPDDAKVTVIDCRFTDIVDGPAIYCGDTSTELKIIRSVIERTQTSSATSPGAPVHVESGVVTLDSSTIAYSRSGSDSGAITILDGGELVLSNSTISNNTTTGNGGAISGENVQVTISNSTIFCNSAAKGSGGIDLTGGASILNLDHTILASNLLTDSAVIDNLPAMTEIQSGGYNLIDTKEMVAVAQGDIIGRKPHLAPLGYYSPDGDFLMPVHALLANSPAIDAGGAAPSGLTLDQRGNPRVADGDASGSSRIDIGAFEASRPVWVANTNDGGSGSLLQAMGLANAGGRVLFDPSLNGAQLTISSALVVPHSVQIDATSLPDGFTLNGNLSTRILRNVTNAHLALHAINLRGGSGANQTGNGYLQTNGHSLFSHCSITQNQGGDGAGLFIQSGSCFLQNCTIANNASSGSGAALNFRPGTIGRLDHCTLTNNVSGSRGSVVLSTAKVYARATIFAANTVGATLDNFSWDGSFTGQLVSLGYNATDDTLLISPFAEKGDFHSTPLNLAPLSDNGGWSLSVATSDGHLVDVIETGAAHPSFDGRGFTRRAGPGLASDIGAYEHLGETQDSDGDQMPDWWECLHGLVVFSPNTLEAGQNLDGDAFTNLQEFQNGTDPRVADAQPEVVITNISINAGNVFVDFIGTAGTSVQFEFSTDLVDWVPLGPPINLTGNLQGYATPVVGLSGYYHLRKLAP